jgi:hypothetical protein
MANDRQADPSTMTPKPLSFDSVFAEPRAPHQPFVVKASIDFPGYRVWVEMPISERDEHQLKTDPQSAHALFSEQIAPALDAAIEKHLRGRRSTKPSDVLGWMDSEGPVTRAPGKPANDTSNR